MQSVNKNVAFAVSVFLVYILNEKLASSKGCMV